MSRVSAVVWVIQHGSCSTWNSGPETLFNVKTSSGLGIAASSQNENRGGGSSPGWTRQRLKSIDRPLSRQGVPVLNLPTSNPSSFKLALNPELVSAILPPGLLFSPTCSNPRKNVPAVMTIASPAIITPKSVSTAVARPSATMILETVACLTSRPRGSFQNRFHPKLVGLLVALNSRRADRWAL